MVTILFNQAFLFFYSLTYLLIPAAVAQKFNPIAELAISIKIPRKEAKT